MGNGRPSCWYDCNGCGDCEAFREYMGEGYEESPEEGEVERLEAEAMRREE